MTTALRALFDGFLLSKEADGIRPRTAEAYELMFQTLVQHFPPEKLEDPGTLTNQDFQEWVIALRERLATATLDQRLAKAKAFFNWCVREGYMESNPIGKVKRPKKNWQPDPLSEEEITMLLQEAKHGRASVRNYAIVCVLLDSGIRNTELCKLKVEDVSIKTGELKIHDAKGNRMAMTYDDVYHTFRVAEVYPVVNGLAMSTTAEYDARWGVVTSSTDVNGQVSLFDYDVHGRLSQVWAPPDAGSATPTVAYVYTDTSTYRLVITQRKETYGEPETLDERAYYNGDGQLLQVQVEAEDPDQVIVVDYGYDALKRLETVSVPYTTTQTGDAYLTPDSGQPATRYAYDRKDRVTRITHPDNTIIQVDYFGWQRKIVWDENGHARRYIYDGHERPVWVEEFSGSPYVPPYAVTGYEYDALGRLATVIDTQSHTTTITYDSLGRKTAMTDPDLGTWAYTYDDNGNLETQTDARGVVTTLSWDAWDRPESKAFSDDTPDVTYTYDQGTYGKGRLAAVDNSVSRRAYAYDAVGRVEAETTTVDGVPYTTGYGYDPLGRLRTMTYPGGEVVTHDYNGQGLLEGLGGTVDYVTGMEYNALGQATRLALGNGRTTTYEYEPDSFRLSRLTTDGGLQDLSYRYDDASNVTAFFDGVTGLDLSYEYDFLDRLVGVSGTYSRSYEYDPLGNLTNKAGIEQSYDDPAHVHAVTGRSDGKTYSYDLNGNPSAPLRAGMTDRAGQTLTWDAENRLTEVVSGTTTTEFAYDGAGVRVKKTVGNETTVYAAPHFEVVISGTQVISTSYYYALGRAVAMRQGEALYHLHGDHPSFLSGQV